MSSPLFPNFSGLLSRVGSSLARSSSPASAASTAELRTRGRQIARRLREAAAGQRPGSRAWARQGLNSLWDVMASAGQGPLGEVVQALLRPQGVPLAEPEREIASALNLVANMLDQQTLITGPISDTPQQRSDERDSTNRGEAPLPSEFEYRQTEPRRRGVSGNSSGYADDDPVMTGQMILVESSNVHSIGYRWNEANPSKGTLLVRFWEKEKGRKTAAGSTYAYYDVHPQVFKAFEIAASKGRFVWDRLRIRGTVTGHQYDYRLVGIGASGYVPRKATRYGNNEYFLRRSVQGRNGQTYTSRLPDRLVNRVTERTLSRLQRGESLPYRGQTGGPNRGTPNRGR